MKASETVKTTSKKLTGKVLKLSSTNTIKVRVESKSRHPLYGKIIKSHKNYLVHTDNSNEVAVGDDVQIQSTKPISKSKSFVLISKVNRK